MTGFAVHLKVSHNLHTVTRDNKCDIFHILLSISHFFGVNNTKKVLPMDSQSNIIVKIDQKLIYF